MIYISELNIERFRGINGLELKNLGDINIIVGANNSGKTSILEAIKLLEYPKDIGNAIKVASMRHDEATNRFDSFLNMFSKIDSQKRIALNSNVNRSFVSFSIEGIIEKRLINALKKINPIIGHKYKGPLQETECFVGFHSYKSNNESYENEIILTEFDENIPIEKNGSLIKTEYISPIDHVVKNDVSSTIIAGYKKDTIELLQIFDNKINSFELVDKVTYIDHADLRVMPLSTYGDGLKKVLLLASSIVDAKDGVLLIDELETAIHFSALKDIFGWFIKACQRFNVQVFATTHSIEVIDALLQDIDLSENKDLIRVITLKKRDGKTLSRVLTGEKAYYSRIEYEMELR